MFSGIASIRKKPIRTKFKKNSSNDRENTKERKKHHDKATYRLIKQENEIGY